jgi:DNA-binding IclR family transcriptional regulator
MSYRVPSVEKCFQILQTFQTGSRELSLGEIVRATRIQKTTAFRILSTLEAMGYVVRNPDTVRYRLGPRTLDLASSFFSEHSIADVCRPRLAELVSLFSETASLAVRRSDDLVYALIADSPLSLRMVATVGAIAPYHATGLGKAVAANFTATELERLVLGRELRAYTNQTITDPAHLRQELANVKAQGYSVDNEEVEAGASCVAAPILGYLGDPVGAISISGPTMRVAGRRNEMIAAVKQAAEAISAKIGFLFFLAASKNRANAEK